MINVWFFLEVTRSFVVGEQVCEEGLVYSWKVVWGFVGFFYSVLGCAYSQMRCFGFYGFGLILCQVCLRCIWLGKIFCRFGSRSVVDFLRLAWLLVFGSGVSFFCVCIVLGEGFGCAVGQVVLGYFWNSVQGYFRGCSGILLVFIFLFLIFFCVKLFK